jgi:hypothetical protein
MSCPLFGTDADATLCSSWASYVLMVKSTRCTYFMLKIKGCKSGVCHNKHGVYRGPLAQSIKKKNQTCFYKCCRINCLKARRISTWAPYVHTRHVWLRSRWRSAHFARINLSLNPKIEEECTHGGPMYNFLSIMWVFIFLWRQSSIFPMLVVISK